MIAMVLEPSFTYADLDATLTTLGWVRTGGTTLPPLVEGEPEAAVYALDGAGTLTYSCNPAVWLRVLDLSSAEPLAAAALAVALPHIGDDAVAALLRQGDVEHLLLGVLATGVLRSPRHLDALRALAHHRDPTVARAAATTAAHLVR